MFNYSAFDQYIVYYIHKIEKNYDAVKGDAQNMIRKKQIPPPTMFGKNLRTLRSQSGIGQTALAHKLSLSRQKIASYEAGFVEPNAWVFLSVCAYFRVDPVIMLNEEITPAENQQVTKFNSGHASGEVIPDLEAPEMAMEQLRAITDEFDKILEGYELFHSFREKHPELDDEESLSVLYNDLLSIMHRISETNHAFLGRKTRIS